LRLNIIPSPLVACFERFLSTLAEGDRSDADGYRHFAVDDLRNGELIDAASIYSKTEYYLNN